MKLCVKALLAGLVAMEVSCAPILPAAQEIAERYVPGSTGAYPQQNQAQAAQASTIPSITDFIPAEYIPEELMPTDKAAAGPPPRQVRLHYGNAVVIDNYLLLVITDVYANPCSFQMSAICGMALTLSVQEGAGSQTANLVKLVEGGKALTPSGYTLGLIDVTPGSAGQPLPAYDAVISYVKPTGETAAINTNLVNWKLRGSDNYKYTFENHSKKVASLLQEPATVTVYNDRVANATFPKFPTMPVPPEIRNSYPTINKLFDTIKAAYALEPPAAKIEVEWDAQMSYPTKIFIDYRAEVADDEFFVTATNLRLLPREQPKKIEYEGQKVIQQQDNIPPMDDDKEMKVPKPTPNPNLVWNANTDGLDALGGAYVAHVEYENTQDVYRTPPNAVLNAQQVHGKMDVQSDLPDRAPPVPKGRPMPKEEPFKPEIDGPQIPELPVETPKKSGGVDSGAGPQPKSPPAPADSKGKATTPAVRLDHGSIIIDPVDATVNGNKQQKPAQQQADPTFTGTTYDKPLVNPKGQQAPPANNPQRKRLRA